MSNYAKYFSLSYDSAAVSKGRALKTNYFSLRLIKETGTVNPKKPSYLTNILLNGSCIDAQNRKLYLFYIDSYYNSAWIIEINIDNRAQRVIYYDRYNTIGFDPKYKIYNPRVVNGRIIWTDGKNPVYQIDIERAWRSYYYGIGYTQPVVEWDNNTEYMPYRIVSYGKYFYKSKVSNKGVQPSWNPDTWESLCLIEDAYYSMNIENFYFAALPPKNAPVVQYLSDSSRKINNLKYTLFQIAYRYVYMDWRRSTFSPASMVSLPQGEEEVSTGLANEQIDLNNDLNITVNLGGEEVRAVEIVGRSSADPSHWFLIDTIDKFKTQERENERSISFTTKKLSLGLTIKKPVVTTQEVASTTRKIVGLTVKKPAITLNYIDATVKFFEWLEGQYGKDCAKSTEIILRGVSTCIIERIPEWITVERNDIKLNELDTISQYDTLEIFPTNEMTENISDYVILKDEYNDTLQLVVEYLIRPGSVTVNVEVEPESQDLIIMDAIATGEAGSRLINVVFTPIVFSLGYCDVNLSYRILLNGSLNKVGNIMVHNRIENEIILYMVDIAHAGDIVDIYLGLF